LASIPRTPAPTAELQKPAHTRLLDRAARQIQDERRVWMLGKLPNGEVDLLKRHSVIVWALGGSQDRFAEWT